MDADFSRLPDAGRDSPDLEPDLEGALISPTTLTGPPTLFSSPTTRTRKRSMMSRSAPRPIHTPTSPMSSSIPHNLLPSAPASPPTPAPSPSPTRQDLDWSQAKENEDPQFRGIRSLFKDLNIDEKKRLLGEVLNMCDTQLLSFVKDFVTPRLQKDPFMVLPDELILRILENIEDPATLTRASQVSRRWNHMVNDDMAWKALCEKFSYDAEKREVDMSHREKSEGDYPGAQHIQEWTDQVGLDSARKAVKTPGFPAGVHDYRSFFKQRFMVETAWRSGGHCDSRQITPDQGVVTSLHLTDQYIIVALDNAKIHVFDQLGNHKRTLLGHVMGVWAMVPWGDLLVSGGCDRDVRVWNLNSGTSIHVLRGHTSTVRCLKMSDARTAISGSRDTTLRIWDLEKGICKHVLVGHQASVRCLDIHGDLVVSGSYDTTARIWSISEGRCLRTLTGHFSQIYAIAFDGKKIATGSLDTSVRIWDPTDGRNLAVLQGHTSLVGQLQMRGDVLVTGGSDGSVRVWSLADNQPIHRLAAHDNSVTSLQFDHTRIVSGGSDGRVKVWDLKTGLLVRELGSPAEAVWRVVFEEEKAVVMASRAGRTIMEVWSFSPQDEPRRSSSITNTMGPPRLPLVPIMPERASTSDSHSDVAMTDVTESS